MAHWLDLDLFRFALPTLPPLLTGFFIAGLGIYVLARERGSPASLIFAGLTAVVMVWQSGLGMVMASRDAATGLLWARIVNVGVAFIPTCLLAFAATVTGNARRSSWILFGSSVASLAAAFAAQSSPHVVSGVDLHSWGYYTRYGKGQIPFLAILTLSMAGTFKLFWDSYRSSRSARGRRQLRAFLVAFFFSFLGAVDYLPAFGFPGYPFGWLAIGIFAFLTARTIARDHLTVLTPSFAAEQIVQTLNDALLVCDDAGIIRIANPEACRMLRYKNSELIGLTMDSLLPQAGAAGAAPLPGQEATWLARDGTPVSVAVSASPLFDDEKERIGTVLLARDLTERQRLEGALAGQFEFMKALLDNLANPVFYKDAQGRYLGCNRIFAERIFGVSQERILGRTLLDFPDVLPAEIAQKYHQDDLEISRRPGQRNFEANVKCADGIHREFLFSKATFNDASGAPAGVIAVMTDISAQKQMQEELRKLSQAVEQNASLVLITDTNGRIEYVNKRFTEVTGYTAAEVRGKTPRVLKSGEMTQTGYGELWRTIRAGREWHGELHNRKKSGELYWALAVISPIRNDAGEITHYVGVQQDITDRRKAEQDLLRAHEALKAAHGTLREMQLQLIQAAKFESAGRLAAGVAHEVKNPLAIIMMGLEFVKLRIKDGEDEAQQVVADMVGAVQRADAIIHGLLDFAAAKQLRLRLDSLNKVVEGSMLLVRHQLDRAGVRADCRFDSSLPDVMLDRQKLEQVFINLFTNAAYVMPQGGTLTVTTSREPLESLEPVLRHALQNAGLSLKSVVVATVEDTGTGISEASLRKLFDPFFTTKPTGVGTGLGLAVSKSIIELHGGTIDLANRPEGGARATVVLPLPERAFEETAA